MEAHCLKACGLQVDRQSKKAIYHTMGQCSGMRAGPCQGHQEAVFEDELCIEVAILQESSVVGAVLDLQKLYDHISLDWLLKAGLAMGYLVRVLLFGARSSFGPRGD